MSTDAADYKSTLNLPKTTFDMKANLIQREPAMLKAWQEGDLYGRIRGRGHPKGKWVLHDGPPYANGDIHMGHLINKTLKDFVVKFRTMQGHDSPYVPGWDCHGLPIESAIMKDLGPKLRELSRDEFRKRCHEYAMKYVALQTEGFKRLGVFGSYEKPYLTLDPNYEAGITEVLAELVKRDLVYRQKKPVHWCTNDRTALAEAELEYANRKDNSIYVLFELTTGEGAAARPTGAHLMIWTTTPWTLPANRAVAVHPEHTYCYVRFTDKAGVQRRVVLAERLGEQVLATGGITSFEKEESFTGAALVGEALRYRHPLDASRLQPIVVAEYVTLEDGTGLVHTAPGHGAEDYQTGKREGLEIYNPVLADGRYDETVPEFLRADPKTTIWDANKLVIEKLRETGALFHHAEFDHSYPHCWRCKKPTIFRATEQWFVKASGPAGPLHVHDVEAPSERTVAPNNVEPVADSPLWSNAVRYVEQVKWIPAWGKNRIGGMLETRPDWCISRQRSWGVPIPAFYDIKGRTLLTEASARRIAAYFRQHGADAWYTHTPAQLLGLENDAAAGLRALGFPADVDVATLEKGMDILDVWFESGASHHAVLESTHPELGYPADMYLEGSDQHRGWFQASLLEAAGYKDVPPFKEVLTHGFVVDEKGRKMSKSEGNDIKVADALKKYGADVLRLWVCSVDYHNDIPCGWALFDKTGEAYRKIRNTIRYLLGNLYDFNPQTDSVEPAAHSIDRWMLNRVNAMAAEVYGAFDAYEFHKVFRLVYEFCNVEISAVYAKAIKDRLYCELPGSARRRASQTVCYRTLMRLVELTAPVLVYTADEAWAAVRQLPGCEGLAASVHLHVMAEPKGEVDAEADAHWAVLMPLVEAGNKQLDELKKTVGLGNSLDAEAVITVPAGDALAGLMGAYGVEIEDALACGHHRVEEGEKWDIRIEDVREKYASCARSWKRRPDVGSVAGYGDLSARDAGVVAALRG